MQVEQPGLAGVPVAYMPNGWQAPVLISHNGMSHNLLHKFMIKLLFALAT